MSVCLYSNIFYFLNFIFGQIEIHNKKLLKNSYKFQMKKKTLSGSNFIFIFLNIINGQIEIHNKKLSFQKITEKIDRNLK